MKSYRSSSNIFTVDILLNDLLFYEKNVQEFVSSA